MIQIFDEKKLEDALEQGKIRDKFSCSDLSFLLFQYDEGELINYTGNPCKYLQFLIQGELMIYAQRRIDDLCTAEKWQQTLYSSS